MYFLKDAGRSEKKNRITAIGALSYWYLLLKNVESGVYYLYFNVIDTYITLK